MLKAIIDAVIKGDRSAVAKKTQAALESGMAIKAILNDGLIAGMGIVGDRFKKNEVFIPEVLISAKAMQAGVALLEPHFVAHGIEPLGKVVIGTVKGDLHDIGKNIVTMMLKGACFSVEDFGIDVPAARFVDAAKKGGVDIIALSSLLTTSMRGMEETIRTLKELGLNGKVKVMVGGAPVTKDFAASIGADGYAKDAASAVDVAKNLMRR